MFSKCCVFVSPKIYIVTTEAVCPTKYFVYIYIYLLFNIQKTHHCSSKRRQSKGNFLFHNDVVSLEWKRKSLLWRWIIWKYMYIKERKSLSHVDIFILNVMEYSLHRHKSIRSYFFFFRCAEFSAYT